MIFQVLLKIIKRKKLIKACYQKALKLLSRRELSSFKLRRALQIYSPQDIDQVLKKLEEKNYLNDERYLKLRINSFKRKLKSRLQVLYLLKQEGFKLNLKELDTFYSQEEELLIYKTLLEKNYKNLNQRGFYY